MNGEIIANGNTLRGMCRALLKMNSDILSQCAPVSDEKGRVKYVRLVSSFRKDGKRIEQQARCLEKEDIRKDLSNIEFINIEIQSICRIFREIKERLEMK